MLVFPDSKSLTFQKRDGNYTVGDFMTKNLVVVKPTTTVDEGNLLNEFHLFGFCVLVHLS